MDQFHGPDVTQGRRTSATVGGAGNAPLVGACTVGDTRGENQVHNDAGRRRAVGLSEATEEAQRAEIGVDARHEVV